MTMFAIKFFFALAAATIVAAVVKTALDAVLAVAAVL
jgi:hypothetical protein